MTKRQDEMENYIAIDARKRKEKLEVDKMKRSLVTKEFVSTVQ